MEGRSLVCIKRSRLSNANSVPKLSGIYKTSNGNSQTDMLALLREVQQLLSG